MLQDSQQWNDPAGDEDPLDAQTSAKYPMGSFEVPPAVIQWANGGYKEHTLVLYGREMCGKTEFLRSLAVFLGKRYYFVNDMDQLRGVRFRRGDAIVFDEVNFRKSDPEWFKNFTDTERGHCNRVRYEHVYVPKFVPRLISTNAGTPEEFLPKPVLEHDLGAMMRRCTWVKISTTLIQQPSDSALPSAPQPQQQTAPQGSVDTNAMNALRELVAYHQSGILTDVEFAAAKAKILGL